MSVVRNEGIEILALKQAVQRVRETVWMLPAESRAAILRVTDQTAVDTAKLETDLVAAGYLPENGTTSNDNSPGFRAPSL